MATLNTKRDPMINRADYNDLTFLNQEFCFNCNAKGDVKIAVSE
jgi:hypothetical protein